MNKNFKYYAGIWAILLVIFNTTTFVSPNEAAGMTKFGGAFWVGYIFITLAFIGQLAVSFFAFNTKNMQKFFYKIPLIRISWTGLVLTLVFGVLCMAIPDLPNWVGIIACFVVLAFNAIALAKANIAADIVNEIDDKVKTQTAFIKTLTVDAESLISRSQNETAKAAAKKVYEAVRYSDPISNDELSGIESKIAIKFNQFAVAITANSDDIATIADELIVLTTDRNKRCKLLKRGE